MIKNANWHDISQADHDEGMEQLAIAMANALAIDRRLLYKELLELLGYDDIARFVRQTEMANNFIQSYFLARDLVEYVLKEKG